MHSFSSSAPTTTLCQHAVCEDLILACLEKLPSKSLVPLRGVSRLFNVLVDEILRGRFLNIATCETHQLVLESSAVYDNRKPAQQTLAFSHFVESSFPVEAITAHFEVTSKASAFLPLDDDEVFGNNLIGVTLQSLESDPISDLVGAQRTFAMPYTRISGNFQPPPRYLSDFSWSLSLASSLDRFFKDWFTVPISQLEDEPTIIPDSAIEDDSDVLSITPSSSRETTPPAPPPHPPRRRSRTQLLNTSNASQTSSPSSCPSALKSASLECFALDSDDEPTYGSHSYPFLRPAYGQPKLFEYHFSSVRLDVGKVVVAAEEGLKGTFGRNVGKKSPFSLFA